MVNLLITQLPSDSQYSPKMTAIIQVSQLNTQPMFSLSKYYIVLLTLNHKFVKFSLLTKKKTQTELISPMFKHMLHLFIILA